MPKNTAATSVPEHERRSEYILLNRALNRCDEKERDFILEFLEKCADEDGVLEPPEVALNFASARYRLGIYSEDLDERTAQIIRSVQAMKVNAQWLLEFFVQVAIWMERDGTITIDAAANLFGLAIDEVETEIGQAREALRNYPEALAGDIRKAAAALPDVEGVRR